MLGYWEREHPLWEREGHDWPHRDQSRFVKAGGLTWHVQVMGEGPILLLLHGIAAANHSWRDLAPLLASDFTVVAPDLPGHGFTNTGASTNLTLPGMALAVRRLLDALELEPAIVAGHSAGAAVLVRMAIDRLIAPAVIVSLNGALIPFGGDAGPIASSLARLLFLNPFTPRFFAWTFGGPEAAERLIERTGSTIDAKGLELYARMARRPAHVGSALGMMAHWDLATLNRDLHRLDVPLVLVVGTNDRAISPGDTVLIRNRQPLAEVVHLAGLGHLAHEEDPELVARLLAREAVARGVRAAA